jgi:hypothetical protein
MRFPTAVGDAAALTKLIETTYVDMKRRFKEIQ